MKTMHKQRPTAGSDSKGQDLEERVRFLENNAMNVIMKLMVKLDALAREVARLSKESVKNDD